MANKPIKTGLIGYGLSGRVFHAPFINLAEGFDLKLIAQRTSDSSKLDYPQTNTVRSYQDILQDREIELVIVATPNDSHFELAKQVLSAGKHVIVEKPFAPTLAETNELIQIAEKKNLRLFVFHNRRWDADFLTVKQIIESGLLGDIVAYEAHYDRYKPELNPKPWKETEGPASGILYDLGTHIIDQAVCLFGAPESVTAQLSRQRKGTQIDDCFNLRLDYGALNVTLKSTLLARELGPKYIVYGRKGSFIKSGIDPQEDDMQAGISPLSENWGFEKQANWGTLNTSMAGLNFRGTVESIQGNYMRFYENVVDVIRNNAPYAISPESAQITTAIIQSALESHKTQKRLPLKKPDNKQKTGWDMSKTLENGETDVYDAGSLIDFSSQLLHATGLEQEKAETVAEILVEGDLMGHSTHGLQLLPSYLESIEDGTMKKEGKPIVISDYGSGVTWDGQYLPGPWLTTKALDMAIQRSSEHPVVTVTIQKSHHIGCLAAYMKRATDENLLVWLTCSDPSIQSVAPFGGMQPMYTPNPIAAGIPTTGDPIIFDVSMSAVANGVIAKADRENRLLGGKWVLDNTGEATDDPKALFADPPGTILPLGGTDLGYKGFALGLFVEALTSGLSGHGRSDNPKEWGASVFLQVINPKMFGGTDFFLKETSWFSDAAKANPAKKEENPVRLPGYLALQKKELQLKEGIKLSKNLIGSLNACSKQFQVSFPNHK